MRLLALMSGVLGGCATTQAVDVYIVNIKPLPSTLFEQRAEIEVRFQNLESQPIEARGVNLRLAVNEKRLAQGVSNRAFTIPPLSEARAQVAVSSGLFDTVRQLLSVPARESFSYELRGRIHTGGIDKRFRAAGELSKQDLQALAPPSGTAP